MTDSKDFSISTKTSETPEKQELLWKTEDEDEDKPTPTTGGNKKDPIDTTDEDYELPNGKDTNCNCVGGKLGNKSTVLKRIQRRREQTVKFDGHGDDLTRRRQAGHEREWETRSKWTTENCGKVTVENTSTRQVRIDTSIEEANRISSTMVS